MKSVFPILVVSRRALLLCALAPVVAACSSKEKTEIINQTPEGITLRYDSQYSTMSGVDADEHCAKYGKRAVLADSKKDESIIRPHAEISVFDCVDK
jgi:hypothetical protein